MQKGPPFRLQLSPASNKPYDHPQYRQVRVTKVSKDILRRLQRWILYVETQGLLKTRKIPGLHDEPPKGDRRGDNAT